jgi:DNA-binding response OmpR family regulator
MPPQNESGAEPSTEEDDACIVLAERDEHVRATLARELSRARRRVITAWTGAQVVDAVHTVELRESGHVDVLVLDDELPIMSGLVALEVLRDEGFYIPIVLLTDHTDASIDRRAASYGARLLRKPIDIPTLRAAVRDAVRSGPAP